IKAPFLYPTVEIVCRDGVRALEQRMLWFQKRNRGRFVCDAPTDGRRPQLDGIWRQILRPIACRRVVLHDNISAVTNILQQAIIVFKEIFPAEVSAYADDDRVILRQVSACQGISVEKFNIDTCLS